MSQKSTTENYDVAISEFISFNSSCLNVSYLTWIVEMDTDNPITAQTWLHQQLCHTWQVSHPSGQNFQHNWIFLLKPVEWETDGIQNVLNQKSCEKLVQPRRWLFTVDHFRLRLLPKSVKFNSKRDMFHKSIFLQCFYVDVFWP